MGYQANYDITRIRELPFDVLRTIFPKTCLVVTGSTFVRTGGYRSVADEADSDRTRVVPNGKRVEQCGRTFTDYTTAVNYAHRVYGTRDHYTIRVLIPEIDCPGER